MAKSLAANVPLPVSLPHSIYSQDMLRDGGRYLYNIPSVPQWLQRCWQAPCQPRAPGRCSPGRGPTGIGCSQPGTGRPATPGGRRTRKDRKCEAQQRPFRAMGSGQDLPTCLPTSSRGVAMVCSGQDGNQKRKGHCENGDGENRQMGHTATCTHSGHKSQASKEQQKHRTCSQLGGDI